MKILLLGKDGQVGWELQRSLAPLGELVACGRKEADLEDLDALRTLVERHAPQIIVNAAAYTAVDNAESEPDCAQSINGDAVAVLANAAARTNAWLVHYSTDYVFDGESTKPYTENDTPAPRSAYGRSKLAGEEAIRASGCKHLIFRTSWVFAARGGNFAKTMLRLAGEREELRVIADQFGAPTSAELIADVTALTLYRCIADNTEQFSGTYHLAAAGETSWYGYACYVIEEARKLSVQIKTARIQAIPTEEYPLPAARPANSRLDTGKLCRVFNLAMPHWTRHVDRMIDELFA